ncbi:MAG: HEAT repeat domain-containing protein [bacterium]
MFLYRGKDIGGREKLTDTCLRIISEGDAEEILDILPHIRVLRSPEFFQPLIQLLNDGKLEQRSAAAAALGSLGDPECIDPLRQAFLSISSPRKREARPLQAAIIGALGEIPSPQAVRVLQEIQQLDPLEGNPGDRHRRLLVSALGQLAQQEVGLAEAELVTFLTESEPTLRSLAVTELALAYWHRPNQISGTLLQQIFDLTADTSDEVAIAAHAGLNSLAQLGCRKAEVLISQLSEEPTA